MNSLTNFNVEQLIEQWYQDEQNGVQFPVDFTQVWHIAGHSTKQKAEQLLKTVLREGFDFSTSKLKNNGKRGRPQVQYKLTCDALEHWALSAQTEEGYQIRQLYIEIRKKWKLVEKHYPKIAEDIELIRMREEHAILDKRIELARLEKEKEQAIFNAQSFRYTITQTCPEHVQQKVLGYTEVKTVEYRDRIIKDDNVINDGSTVNKTWLCKRFGLMRKGKADTKRLNAYLAEMPSEAFELSAYIRENEEFKREYLPLLEQVIERQRQLGLGE